MLFARLIFCALIQQLQSYPNLSLNNYDTNIADNVTDLLFKLCLNCNLILMIYTSDINNDLIFQNVFNQGKNQAIYSIIKLNSNYTTEVELNYNNQPDILMLYVKEYDTIENVVFGIELFSFWNIHSKFFVVIENPVDDFEWLVETFGSFWERQIIRVFICFVTEKLEFFTYNPFLNMSLIDLFKENDAEKLFDGKIKNLYQHPIKLYHFDYVYNHTLVITHQNGKKVLLGRDGIFYNSVADVLNASLDIHYLSEDFNMDVVKNTDASSSFMDYMQVLADIYDYDGVLNALSTLEDNRMDLVILAESNNIRILVPKAVMIPQYMYIFFIIPLKEWCYILSSLFIVSIAMGCIEKVRFGRYNIVILFLENYRILIAESVPDRSQRDKIVFLVWIFHSIIIVTLFQSMLVTSLVKPKYYDEVDSISALVETDLHIYADKISIAEIKRIYNNSNIEFTNKFLAVPTKESLYGISFDWVENYIENNAVAVYEEGIWNSQLESNEVNYHIIKDIPAPTVMSYSFRKERNYYREVRLIYNLLNEAGLTGYWKRYKYGETFLPTDTPNGTLSKTMHEPNNNLRLSLAHLKAAFAFVILGYCCSFILFLIELFLFLLPQNNQNVAV